MDWSRPQPESSYLWDQVPQPLRCYLYDPTSSLLFSLSLPPSFSRSLLIPLSRSRISCARFSFSLSLPSFSLSLGCSLPSFLYSLLVLSAFLLRFMLSTRFPRFFSCTGNAVSRALHPRGCSSRYSPATSRCFSLKVTCSFARSIECPFECQIASICLHPRNCRRGSEPLARSLSIAWSDSAGDDAVESRALVTILVHDVRRNGHQPFQLRFSDEKRMDFKCDRVLIAQNVDRISTEKFLMDHA